MRGININIDINAPQRGRTYRAVLARANLTLHFTLLHPVALFITWSGDVGSTTAGFPCHKAVCRERTSPSVTSTVTSRWDITLRQLQQETRGDKGRGTWW